jgi:hypothetical protein
MTRKGRAGFMDLKCVIKETAGNNNVWGAELKIFVARTGFVTER